MLTWSISIPPDKLSKIVQQLHKLTDCTQVPLKDMQSLVGGLLWLTPGWYFLQPLLIPLYRALHHIPTTMVGMDHVTFQQFLDALSPQLTLTTDLTHRHQSLCQQVKFVRVANTHVHTLDDASKLHLKSRRVWIGILAYRIQHHHLAQLTMRLVKLCVCGRNSLSRPLFRCQCLQQLSCTSLPLQIQWHHSQWQVSEVRHSFHMAIVSGSSSRSHWHRPTSIGTGLVWILCKSTSLHGNFWHSSCSQFASNVG